MATFTEAREVFAMQKAKVRLLLLMGVFVLCCVLPGGTIYISCTTDIPRVEISQSLSSFMGEREHTVNNFVLAAKKTVEQHLRFLDVARTEYVLAHYICQERDCRLQNLYVDIPIIRHIRCPLDENFFITSVPEFIFDVEADYVIAHTYLEGVVTYPVQWEDLPIGIDEVIQTALDVAGQEFTQQHPRLYLGVALHPDKWNVWLGIDPEKASEIRLSIDYNGSLITG